jgi:hypothetical protein
MSFARKNRFAALEVEEMSPVIVPKHYSLPAAWAKSSPEAVAAVEIVQKGLQAQLDAMLDPAVLWGDLAWAEDWIAEQQARDERIRLGLPEPVPAPLPSPAAPVVEEHRHWPSDAEEDECRTWVDNDDCDGYSEPEWVRGAKGMLEKEIHLGPDGKPEECRFFNTKAGCRSGDECPYQHIKRDQQAIECRFFKTARGCRSGSACIYKHC